MWECEGHVCGSTLSAVRDYYKGPGESGYMQLHSGLYPKPGHALRYRPIARAEHGISFPLHGAVSSSSRAQCCLAAAAALNGGRGQSQQCGRRTGSKERTPLAPDPVLIREEAFRPDTLFQTAAAYVASAVVAIILMLEPGSCSAATVDMIAAPLHQQQGQRQRQQGLPDLQHPSKSAAPSPSHSPLSPDLPDLSDLPKLQQRQVLGLPPIPKSFSPLPEIQAPEFVEVRAGRYCVEVHWPVLKLCWCTFCDPPRHFCPMACAPPPLTCWTVLCGGALGRKY